MKDNHTFFANILCRKDLNSVVFHKNEELDLEAILLHPNAVPLFSGTRSTEVFCRDKSGECSFAPVCLIHENQLSRMFQNLESSSH